MDMALESNDMQSALNLLKRAEAELGAGVDVPPERSHTFLGQFSAAWVYATVCTLGVSILERDRRYDRVWEPWPRAVEMISTRVDH